MSIDQGSLLMAWVIVEERGIKHGRSESEHNKGSLEYQEARNDITHELERGNSLESLLPRCPILKKEYSEQLMRPEAGRCPITDLQCIDVCVFVRLLSIIRETLYAWEAAGVVLSRSAADEAAEGSISFDAAMRRFCDFGSIADVIDWLSSQGVLDFYGAKKVNRLRNAFKKQTSRRLKLHPGKVGTIVREVNNLGIHDEEIFIVELRRLLQERNMLSDELLSEITLATLERDSETERATIHTARQFGGASAANLTSREDNYHLGQVLHSLHVSAFKLRAAPRGLDRQKISDNVVDVLERDGFLRLHEALQGFAAENDAVEFPFIVGGKGFSSLEELPDIGRIANESLKRLGKASRGHAARAGSAGWAFAG